MATLQRATSRKGDGQMSLTRNNIAANSTTSISTLVSHSDYTSYSPTMERSSEGKTPIGQRCMLWVHDEAFSKDDVMVDLSLFPTDTVKPGDVMAIIALKTDTGIRDFQDISSTSKRNTDFSSSFVPESSIPDFRLSKDGPGKEAQHDVNPDKRYLFALKEMTREQKIKHPNLQISVAKHIAQAFGFKPRANVLLTRIDSSMTMASHVELSFKDLYLSRSDMWRLTVSELANKTVYKNQKIVFLGTIKATVTAVYVAGRKVKSAFFCPTTKPIFRSESARYVIFIQMSKEMWDFDSEGSGEIMFTKVVNGFLPALFRRWVTLKARHLVSIVLFTRVEYDTGLTTELGADVFDASYHTGRQLNGNKKPYKDFYRVVVSEMSSGEWTSILFQLKREFRFFRHDILTYRLNTFEAKSADRTEYTGMGSIPGTRVEAEPSLAVHGNILEAISLATTRFFQDYIDRDLVRTGISIVVITPNPGVFEVDYETLRRTTETLISTGIGIDLVCLPKMPLHSVPLFKYRNPQYNLRHIDSGSKSGLSDDALKPFGSEDSTPRMDGVAFGSLPTLSESMSPTKASMKGRTGITALMSKKSPEEWSFAIPHWIDVSFWTGASQEVSSTPGVKLPKEQRLRDTIKPFKHFGVRCKMYELEMTSGPETGFEEGTVAPLRNDLIHPMSLEENDGLRLDGYDIIRLRKKHSSLTESAAHVRLSAKSSPVEREYLENLDKFDMESAVFDQSEPTRPNSQKRVRLGRDVTISKTLADDLENFATSFSEANEGQKGLSLAGASISLRKKKLSEEPSPSHRRKESISSVRSTATVASITSTLLSRPPKIMRQISLGARGFGVAASKAAVAELQTENANAATVSGTMSTAQSSSSTAMVNHLLSSPRNEKTQDRPASSQGSLKSTKSGSHSNDSKLEFDKKIERTRPIAIRSGSVSDAPEIKDLSKTRSMLGSVYERTEATGEVGDIPTVQKLKSSDNLRASKAKLFGSVGADLPTTLSPTAALAPWLSVLNPSNPTENDDVASQYRRWHHLYPRPLQKKVMKWKSLCSPASTPLTTDYFPSKLQLDTEYEQKPYNISQEAEDETYDGPKLREDFLRELVSLRLSQGFQIVVGPSVAEAFGQKAMKIANPFDHESISQDGVSVFMSMGNIIHQLSCVNGTEVEVYMFSRKIGSNSSAPEAVYSPVVRTTLAETYESRHMVLHKYQEEYNWNFVDSYLAGHNTDMSESLRFWRARFVLIPIETYTSHWRKDTNEDNAEEIRLEGIKALTQIWQRNRYVPVSERPTQRPGIKKAKDPNPLDIVYQTSDPSIMINAHLETLPLIETGEVYARRGQLLSDAEPFKKSTLNRAELAEAIQAPVDRGGVQMQNRRWHLRLHYNCFIGSDMTTWLLENFDDVETREDAVKLGNELMVKEGGKEKENGAGIFVHVEKRHMFRDGQYFYQVTGEHAKARPETRTGWPFASRKRDVTSLSTPMTESATKSGQRMQSGSEDNDKSSDSGATTPATIHGQKKTKILLSKVMKYDVDPRKRSYRPELMNLHYDRLHNPDNCYHIRLDWMNVTAKLIDDSVQSWATTAERYGLRLIEAPMAEACTITEVHPFRSPYLIKLAVKPPETQPPTFLDATSLVPQVVSIKNFYQKAIMREHDFVLDIEAAANFSSNVEVMYSWGRPDYKYTQYIHRSGVLLAQVNDDGNFWLLSNKLYNNRNLASREAERFNKPDYAGPEWGTRMPSNTTHNPSASPAPSPMLRATLSPNIVHPSTASIFTQNQIQDSHNHGSAQQPSADVFLPNTYFKANNGFSPTQLTPENIKSKLELFCSSPDLLNQFYKDVFDRASPTPETPFQKPAGSALGRASAAMGLSEEGSIPVLGLPDNLLGGLGVFGHGTHGAQGVSSGVLSGSSSTFSGWSREGSPAPVRGVSGWGLMSGVMGSGGPGSGNTSSHGSSGLAYGSNYAEGRIPPKRKASMHPSESGDSVGLDSPRGSIGGQPQGP